MVGLVCATREECSDRSCCGGGQLKQITAPIATTTEVWYALAKIQRLNSYAALVVDAGHQAAGVQGVHKPGRLAREINVHLQSYLNISVLNKHTLI